MAEAVLAVPCRLEQLRLVGEAARTMAEPSVGADAAALVDVAVTEICSNIVRHGHPADPEHQFSVRFRARDDAIEVVISDAGPEYDTHTPSMPSVDVAVDELPEGGFGLALVAATMDEFERHREGGVNVTRLVKRRP